MAMSRSIGWSPFTTREPIRISPSVSSSRPAVSRSTVVLPEPDGPTRTSSSPSAISRSTWSTATVPSSKTLVTPSSVTLPIASASVRVSCDQVAVPERAPLGRPPLVFEVHGDDPEAAVVAVFPLEVVEQRPHVVAADVDTLVDRTFDRGDVVAQVGDALRVLDDRLPVHRWVLERGAVLGDHERDRAVVAAQAQQQGRQRARLDRPAHRRPRTVGAHLVDAEWTVAEVRHRRLVEVDAEEVDRCSDLVQVAVLHEVERADPLRVELEHVGRVRALEHGVEEPAVAVAVEAPDGLGLAGDVRQVERDPELAG